MRLRKPLYLAAGVGLMAALAPTSVPASPSSAPHSHIDCAATTTLCTEVQDSEEVFGQGVYVGHDEPSLVFYSSTAGAGSTNTWKLTLPKDPISTGVYTGGDPRPRGQSFNFQLQPALCFGMAMGDDQSYPERIFNGLGGPCTDASDTNITNNAGAGLASHAGSAFMEMQFYPPGWAEG